MSLEIGLIVEATNSFSQKNVNDFAKITGDLNPLHTNEEYARNSLFGEKIVHGLLIASTISQLLGTKCPGPGTIYLSQTLKFLKPVKIEERFTTQIELVEIIEGKRNPRYKFRTCCINEHNEVILEGEAIVINPDIT